MVLSVKCSVGKREIRPSCILRAGHEYGFQLLARVQRKSVAGEAARAPGGRVNARVTIR